MSLVKTEIRVQFGTSCLKCSHFVHYKWLHKGSNKEWWSSPAKSVSGG